MSSPVRATARFKKQRFFRVSSVVTLAALVALTIAWELVLAPLRPGGSWMALKGLPLLFALRGITAGNTYTYRWAIMLVLAYFAEGTVRLYSESPPSSVLAAAEIGLAAAFFVTAIAYLRTKDST